MTWNFKIPIALRLRRATKEKRRRIFESENKIKLLALALEKLHTYKVIVKFLVKNLKNT